MKDLKHYYPIFLILLLISLVICFLAVGAWFLVTVVFKEEPKKDLKPYPQIPPVTETKELYGFIPTYKDLRQLKIDDRFKSLTHTFNIAFLELSDAKIFISDAKVKAVDNLLHQLKDIFPNAKYFISLGGGGRGQQPIFYEIAGDDALLNGFYEK